MLSRKVKILPFPPTIASNILRSQGRTCHKVCSETQNFEMYIIITMISNKLSSERERERKTDRKKVEEDQLEITYVFTKQVHVIKNQIIIRYAY